MTEAALVEGQVKLRDGKKWKSRWLVLRKPSPVADCLQLLAYKDRSDRAKGLRERSSVTLEAICGLEPGLAFEGLAHTLAIVCLPQAVMLGFDSREAMCAWDARIRYALGEVHRFPVTVAPGTKLESGPATLHLCNDALALARDVPPVVGGQWRLSDLRRYGAVPGGFIFEGGTRCGYYPGPGVPGATPDRVAQEALRLEKRLSLLSHAGRPGSTGDDRSMSSSSSEASHSDVSAGSRLAAWPESASAGTSQEGGQGPGEAAPGASRPPPQPLRPRPLQEVGRQGSSDSGIATGSHSSCSGSFSSCAGSSLDMWCEAGERGSQLSLPPEHSLCACPPAAEYQVPSGLRPHYDTPRSLYQASGDQSRAGQGGPDGDNAARDSGCPPGWLGTRRQGQATEVLPATPSGPALGEPWEVGSHQAGPPTALFSTCAVCGGLKGAAATPLGPPKAQLGGPTYVNIPASPTARTQPLYTSLELREARAGVRGTGASCYAQIDAVATAAAHWAGARHVQARAEQRKEAPR
ncbi:protein Dok-7 isoform X2 [Sorex fumeus]|uniref:protein Dok-7 isoform X2 n=1 Tax=Sorex fumeus TaxID=62283 RepID=UPI0024ACC9ED|nr:protein Dok-7 isoform X2 [Sorex fumeus]